MTILRQDLESILRESPLYQGENDLRQVVERNNIEIAPRFKPLDVFTAIICFIAVGYIAWHIMIFASKHL